MPALDSMIRGVARGLKRAAGDVGSAITEEISNAEKKRQERAEKHTKDLKKAILDGSKQDLEKALLKVFEHWGARGNTEQVAFILAREIK